MDAEYSKEQLLQIDRIVEDLKNKGSIDCKDYSQEALSVLELYKLIIIKRTERGEFMFVYKTNLFDGFFAGGTFSEQYYRKKTENKMSLINIINSSVTNSPFQIGDNNQIIWGSTFDSSIENAIQQLKDDKTITFEEKKDVIEDLSELKECVAEKRKPGRALVKNILHWGEKIISLGGAIAKLYNDFSKMDVF